MKPYQAQTIAEYFLGKGKEEKIKISNMKIIKLVYIAHGWFLAMQDLIEKPNWNNPLIQENIEAWDYGPVIRNLYFEYRKYGADDLVTQLKNIENSNTIDKEIREFLDVIWDSYKDLDGSKLSTITHEEGTPWSLTFVQNENQIITNNIIKQHYLEKAEELNK